MDLRVYIRVLWRFRVIVFVGFVLAVALAFLAMVRVDLSGSPRFEYRQQVTYQANTVLLLTQAGFPWGRTVLPSTTSGPSASATPYADPGRFSSLAAFYAQLANGDAVQALLARDRSLHGKMVAMASSPDPSAYNSVLPLLTISGLATSAKGAARISTAGADLFRHYIQQQQQQAGIPANQRVLLKVLSTPRKVLVVEPRKKTLPIVAFLTVMIATVGFAFVLENLRPRIHLVEGDTGSESPADLSSRQIA